MMRTMSYVVLAACLAACGNADPGGATSGDGGSATSTGANGGSSGGGGGSLDGGANDSGGAASDSGTTTSGDAGALGHAGNPNGHCAAGIPARGQPVDTSHPTTVVGTGTAASCTSAALTQAVAKGGIVTFACGPSPVTIPIGATITVPIDRNTVIDGGNEVTLDGGHAVQIFRFDSPNFQANENGLTLQHLGVVNGKSTPTQAIPPAPAPCSQGWDDGEGGALYMRDGNLTVIDCVFDGNEAAPLGPDTGGGAFYVLGSKHGVVITKSTFTNNKASNGAAVGCLFSELDVYDSLFTANQATGNGANSDDASKCSVINNGQHEVGSGGNGGALYSDGNSVDVNLCGDAVLDNHAGMGAFGGGLFFTSNNMAGKLTIADTTMTGNTGGSWTNVSTGATKNAGSAVGTNCNSLTITDSTLQGVP